MVCSVFGRGLVEDVRFAGAGLMQLNATVIPERITVHAFLGELLVHDVEGFDLSPINAYLWHPNQQAVQLSK